MTDKSNNHLIFIAGGSGAGKGVAKKKLLQQGVISGKEAVFSGAALLGDLPAYKEMKASHRHPEKTGSMRGEYYDLLGKGVADAIANKQDIVIDDHLDNPDLIRSILQDAKAAGYTTLLIGFSASPEAVFDVYQQLSTASGKPADYEWMLASHKNFSTAFEQFAPVFDLSTVFYRELGDAGRAIYMHDSVSNQSEILDEGKYEKFRRWQHARTDATKAEDVLPQKSVAEDRDSTRRSPAGSIAGAERTQSFLQRLKGVIGSSEINM